MKYDFFEALAIVAGTDMKFSESGAGSCWMTYNVETGQLEDEEGNKIAWPYLERQKEKNWIVEPSPIFVWGVCDADGNSSVFRNKPKLTKNIDYPGSSWVEPDSGGTALCGMRDLFPKDKPQKFKLVPVEDSEQT